MRWSSSLPRRPMMIPRMTVHASDIEAYSFHQTWRSPDGHAQMTFAVLAYDRDDAIVYGRMWLRARGEDPDRCELRDIAVTNFGEAFRRQLLEHEDRTIAEARHAAWVLRHV